MPAATWSWLVVGGTTRLAEPAKLTRPTLKRAGISLTNWVAAAWAALSRLGAMSLACMERDTSMATTTVATSRGTGTMFAGRAIATTPELSARMISAAATCRRHPGLRGATERSSCRLLNRTA
jgi:hypothetical protein